MPSSWFPAKNVFCCFASRGGGRALVHLHHGLGLAGDLLRVGLSSARCHRVAEPLDRARGLERVESTVLKTKSAVSTLHPTTHASPRIHRGREDPPPEQVLGASRAVVNGGRGWRALSTSLSLPPAAAAPPSVVLAPVGAAEACEREQQHVVILVRVVRKGPVSTR